MTADERGPRERLAFSFALGTVPGLAATDTPLTDADAATTAVARRTVQRETRDWGYLGLVAFTVVLLVRPQDQIPGLDALHLAEMSAIGAVVAMVAHRASRRLPMLRITPEVTGLLLFGAAILASVPFSVWRTGSLTLFFEAYVKVLIVFVLMVNTLTTPKRLREITWMMVICCTYVAARSLVDYMQGRNLVEGDRLAGAVGGIFGNPNDLAMNLVAFLPAAAVIALGRGQAIRRLIAAGSVACMLAAIVATKSRGGTLGLIAVVLTLMVLGRKVRPGFTVAIVLSVAASIPLMPASFTNRMASIVSDRQDREEYTGSREARSTVMREGLQAFVTHPLTGIGAGQFVNYSPSTRKERWRETHNALLQVAAETGILGLVAFSFLIVRAGMAAAVTRRMLAPPRRRGRPDLAAAAMSDHERRDMQAIAVALTAGLAGWFVCSLFASVAYNWTFYYLLALAVSAREMTLARLASVGRASTARQVTASGVTSAAAAPRGWVPPDAVPHSRAISRGTV